MDDACNIPNELSVADIFQNTKDLLDKMGADEKCKKAADTWGKNASTSGNFYARGSVGWGAAEGEAGGGFQDSSQSFANAMSEEGCGTYAISAIKQSTNIQKVQCAIQKAQNQSEVGVSASNTIDFRTVALTPEESRLQQKLISDINNKYIITVPRPTFKDYSEMILLKILTPEQARQTLLEEQKQWDDSRDSLIKNINNAYSRNISFKNGNITQRITGKIKILSSLSAQESQSIESTLKEISKITAEQELNQKLGLNSGTPNSKTMTDINIQKNENLSSSSINAKVQSIKQTIDTDNRLVVDIAGNINFENVNIDQNILLDVTAESLIASAISAGIKSATEMVSDASTVQKLKTESKGLDDLVKAQGEANAAAINAGKVGPLGMPTFNIGGVMVLGILGILYMLLNNPIIKYTIIAVILIIIIIILANLGSFLFKLREFLGIETIEDKMMKMKRSVDYYNKIWTSFGCTNKLTYDDIMSLKFEAYPEGLVYDALENTFKKSLITNAKQNDINLCFSDGKVPVIFLPKIKMKKPQDLTVPELREIWTKVSKCSGIYFDSFIDQWNKDLDVYNADKTKPFKYLSFGDVAVEIDKCGLEQIKLKLPRDLTDEDLKILWNKYGLCDETKFNSFKGKGSYRTLTTMNDVLNAITKCDLYDLSSQTE
jgi:hypothetical protein